MNIWEKIPFKFCVIVPTYRGTRRGHGLPCTGLPSSTSASGWQGQCDGSFTRNPVLGVGELFLSPASLLSQCHPRELCRSCSRERDAWDGTWMPNPPVPCAAPQSASPPAMGKRNLFSGLLEGIKGQPHRFCRNGASGEMFKSHWFIGPSISNSSSQTPLCWSE